MIEILEIILPLIVYTLMIVLLVLMIILGTRLMKTIDKINRIADFFLEKIESLNNIFKFANDTVGKISDFGSSVVDKVIVTANKIMGIGNSDEYDDF